MCAYDENKDSCNGDSGGPMTVNYKMTNRVNAAKSKRVLIGVVSYGPATCADKTHV